MKIFSKNHIAKLITYLVISAFFTTGTAAAAGEHYFSRSTLSPKIALALPGFSQIFGVQAASEKELLRKTDLTTNRQKFKKDFFDLSFKVLFPELVQYYLVSAINEQMLTGIDNKTVDSIQVSFKTSDDSYINNLYELFEKLGENNFDKIVRATWPSYRPKNAEEERIIKIAKEIIDILLVYDTGKRHDLVGLNPPRAKTEKGKKRKEAIIKKWLLDTMPSFTGYSKKELEKKNKQQLELIYYKFKLAHEFGKKLISEMDNDLGIVFNVSIELDNGTTKESEIRIEKSQGIWKAFAIRQDKQEDKKQKVENNARNDEKNCIFKGLPQDLHKTIHKLQSQRKELRLTMKHLDALRLIRNMNRNDFITKRESIQAALEEIYEWAKRTREVSQKFKVRDSLKKVLGERGYLKKGDYLKVMLMVQESVDALIERIKGVQAVKDKSKGKSLIPMILNSTLKELIPAYNKTKDDAIRAEILKNLFAEIEYYTRQGMFEEALRREYITVNYTTDAKFQTYMFKNYWRIIEDMRVLLFKAADREPYLKLRSSSNDVRNHMQLLIFDLNELTRLRNDLIGWGGWKEIPEDLRKILVLLSGISKPRAQQKNILNRVINGGEDSELGQVRGLNKIIDSVAGGKGQKKIIVKRLLPVKKNLTNMMRAIELRNQAIKQTYPEIEDITVEKAEVLAAAKLKEFESKQDISTGQIMQFLAEYLEGISFILSDFQYANSNNNTNQSRLTPIRDIVPGILENFTKQDAAMQLVGQAI